MNVYTPVLPAWAARRRSPAMPDFPASKVASTAAADARARHLDVGISHIEEAATALDRTRLTSLRARISQQIEADLDRVDRCMRILDALTPDPDLEETADVELTTAEWSGRGAQRFNVGGAA